MHDELFAAIGAGEVERVRGLVTADPELASARGETGLSAVLAALYHHERDVLEALLAAGPELDVLDAAAAGRLDVLRAHLDHADNPSEVRPLHSATAARDHEAVRALLEAGADPNVRQQGGFTPLLSAVHNDDVRSTELLLRHGADPAQAADDGRDPRAMAGERTRPLLDGRGRSQRLTS